MVCRAGRSYAQNEARFRTAGCDWLQWGWVMHDGAGWFGGGPRDRLPDPGDRGLGDGAFLAHGRRG